MVTYKVTVTTGDFLYCDTYDDVYITLCGAEGKSKKEHLVNCGRDFATGQTSTYTVKSSQYLGDILMIILQKKQFMNLSNTSWFCTEVVVKDENEKTYHFPCYCWITGSYPVSVREGTAKKRHEDKLPKNTKDQMENRRALFMWKTFIDEIPKCIDGNEATDVPSEIRFSFSKDSDSLFSAAAAFRINKFYGLSECHDSWSSMKNMKKVLKFKSTNTADYVMENWEKDSFFGYQYLNGSNPILIKLCKEIPQNFPVSKETINTFLQSKNLDTEIKANNIYMVDYSLLDGIGANIIKNNSQYLPAPVCMLYKNNQGQLVPIAIQLNQKPGPDNPIFYPDDSKEDWTLAKIYVRSADFNYYELVTHLLRTHLLAEVFCVALLRQLPSIHPLFKLLVPHMRFTLQINILARNKLLNKGGVFDQCFSSGGSAKGIILQRGLKELTYSSLCLPEDIAMRGVDTLPNYYYRDDGLKVWKITERFVQKMVNFYYPNDHNVGEDTELQNWIKDVNFGLLDCPTSGMPASLNTAKELIKFLTMVIFTCSAQHNAVNYAQFEYCSWMPNASPTMRQPPPSMKGVTTEDDILESIANVSNTIYTNTTIWLLTHKSTDFVRLGTYPDKRFTENKPQQIMKEFLEDLMQLDTEIEKRNKSLEIPYLYMKPSNIENSISI
ncbi:arachidonate 12-lipoxygenase, 12R-type [Amia ocellicauda]|uniref:arachidonate 12-lipoxygenase, 12R-type n=1 Tax=Amia ocellicauda TaxID=2972642 RepID=UPI0034649CDC